MPSLTLQNGEDLFYRDIGAGQPVVFVHGGFMSHELWDYQLTTFAEDYRVIAVDLPGHGDSDKSHRTYTAEGYADSMAELLRRLDLDAVNYVGWSLGATIGTILAGRDGTRLDRLVLVSSGIFHGLAATSDDGLDFDALIEAQRTDRPQAMREFVETIFHRDVGEATLEWVWSVAMQTPLSVALAVLEIYASMDYDALGRHVDTIDVPTALFQGAHDAAATPEEAEYVATELLADGRFVAFEGSGHVPFIEERAAFDDALREFWSEP